MATNESNLGIDPRKTRLREKYAKLRDHYLDALTPPLGVDVEPNYVRKAVSVATTAEMRTEIRLERDEKTGLEKSGAYYDTLQRKLKDYLNGNCDYFAAISLDIDLFSWMNDVLKCKLLGDLTLRALGQIILRSIRVRDGDRAFRKGGEEFGIIPEHVESTDKVKVITLRLLKTIKDKLLEEAVALVEGDRTMTVEKNGREIKERVGTPILREFAKGIMVFKQPSGADYLMNRGKGTLEGREALRVRIMDINEEEIRGYEEYLANQRLWGELSDEEKVRRTDIERKLGQQIRRIFQQITCSAGVLVLTPKDKTELTEAKLYGIEGELDRLVYNSKTLGGNTLVMQSEYGRLEPQIFKAE